MIVVSDYRGYRIEMNATAVETVAADRRYHAEVRMLRVFAREKPRVETVTCYKLTLTWPSTPANYGPSAGLT